LAAGAEITLDRGPIAGEPGLVLLALGDDLRALLPLLRHIVDHAHEADTGDANIHDGGRGSGVRVSGAVKCGIWGVLAWGAWAYNRGDVYLAPGEYTGAIAAWQCFAAGAAEGVHRFREQFQPPPEYGTKIFFDRANDWGHRCADGLRIAFSPPFVSSGRNLPAGRGVVHN
jgi:hypothetical protein